MQTLLLSNLSRVTIFQKKNHSNYESLVREFDQKNSIKTINLKDKILQIQRLQHESP